MAILLVISPLARAHAYLDDPGASRPRSDHVLRSRPLDLFSPSESPVEQFVAKWKLQEANRMRALRDEYPAPDPWTGRYDAQQMRDWQRRVIHQQGDAILGAAGDAALERCMQLPFCQSKTVRAVAMVASAMFRGIHVGTPLGPFHAHLDAPPGYKSEIRRVRVSLEYRLVF